VPEYQGLKNTIPCSPAVTYKVSVFHSVFEDLNQFLCHYLMPDLVFYNSTGINKTYILIGGKNHGKTSKNAYQPYADDQNIRVVTSLQNTSTPA
jgi:hypothetical protein